MTAPIRVLIVRGKEGACNRASLSANHVFRINITGVSCGAKFEGKWPPGGGRGFSAAPTTNPHGS